MTKTRSELIRELFEAVFNNDTAKIEEFRDKKDLINSRYKETENKNVNPFGGQYTTPLMVAANYSNSDAVRLLISLGADVNAKDSEGDTPLHWAALSYAETEIKVLMICGADIFAKNKAGKSPFDLINVQSIKDEIVQLHNIYNKVAGKQIFETRKAAHKIVNNVRVMTQKASIGNKDKLESHSSLAILPADILGEIISYLNDVNLTPDAVKNILKACKEFQKESASIDNYLNNYPETIFDFVTHVTDYLATKFPYIAKTMQAKSFNKHIDNIEKILTEGSQKNHTDRIIREHIAQETNINISGM